MMQSSSRICCTLLLGVLLVNPICSYVVDKSSSSTSSSSEETTEATPSRQHISRIVRPGEIATPTLSEITQFFGAAEFDDNRLGGPNFVKNEQLTVSSNANDKNTLSFNDLLTLLAIWHLSNEFNNYEVQAEQGSAEPLTPEMRANDVQK